MEVRLHNNKFDLTDKIAVVTGGAGLLGFEHASALIEAGSIVYLADINEKNVQKFQKKSEKLYPYIFRCIK